VRISIPRCCRQDAWGVHRAFIARPLRDATVRRRLRKLLTNLNAPRTFAGGRVEIMKEIIGRNMGF
jgi:hypothetical protein